MIYVVCIAHFPDDGLQIQIQLQNPVLRVVQGRTTLCNINYNDCNGVIDKGTDMYCGPDVLGQMLC